LSLSGRSPREQRSLFGEILDWMLAPLLLLWPMSLGLTWVVAQSIAYKPYDRELADVALALARQASAQLADGPQQTLALRRELERTAAVLTRSDDEDDDLTYFQVLGARGELVAGEARLGVPAPEALGTGGLRFRDDVLGDEPVRVAYLHLPGVNGDGDALVQVAETLGKRSRLATEIIKGVLLPQFVILPLAVMLVWFALARGVRPLADLQQRIRQRVSTDLSPIPTGGVPDEVAPLVEAINDLLKRLDQNIATQRHFLADAAHQLKTPLAGLRMQAELATRDIDGGRGDSATMKHSLQQIATSSQRAAHMVNQLLAMARAEDAGQVMPRVPVDLAEITRAVVRDFVPKAMDRRIDLGYEGPESAGTAGLLGEPVLLGEMVRNLVDNALQYTPSGGTVTVRVVPDPFGQVVVLQVEDTGPGIPAAEREAVFRPFYRALGTEVDGSGLGLAIVREIAERHDGEVVLDDARPRSGAGGGSPGALFTVRLHVDVAAGKTLLPGPPPT
jgi:two-component system sensor histidine kinase TctE